MSASPSIPSIGIPLVLGGGGRSFGSGGRVGQGGFRQGNGFTPRGRVGSGGLGGAGLKSGGGLQRSGGLRGGGLRAGGLRAGGLRTGGLRTGGLRTGGLRGGSLRKSGGLRSGRLKGGRLRTPGLHSGSRLRGTRKKRLLRSVSRLGGSSSSGGGGGGGGTGGGGGGSECCGTPISGLFELIVEYGFDEYGRELAPVVTKFVAQIQEIDWTPVDWRPYAIMPQVYEPGVTFSAAEYRFESDTKFGLCCRVALDLPNTNGRLISTEDRVAAVSAADPTGSRATILPAPGTSTFHLGQYLRPVVP